MRILLDTSFLYSALFHPSTRFNAILDFVFSESDPLIPAYVADELIRKAKEKRPEALELVMAFLEHTEVVESQGSELFPSPPQMRDPNDQPILDAAIHHGVDIIISSDKDFTSLKLDRPRIMTPAEFIAEFL